MEYNKQQFERLFRENYPMMYRLAFSLLEDGEDAKDAVHQVFTEMWHRKPQVEEAALRGYLLTAVRNQCLHALRKRALQRRMEAESRLHEQEEQRDEHEELMAELRRVIAEHLTEQDRRILSLHYDEEMSYAETAEALGISASAVNKHITQSLSKIRTYLKIAR